MKKILFNNLTVILYIVLAYLIEVAGSFITDGKVFIRDPRYILTIILFFSALFLLIKSQKIRLVAITIVLLVQALINLLFTVMYDMTEQYFDFSMFSLRNDAMGIIESIPINYWFFMTIGITLAIFIVYIRKMIRRITPLELTHKQTIYKNICLVSLVFISLILNLFTAININSNQKDPYMELLKGNSASQYNEYGITSNFINELYSGTILANDTTMPHKDIADFFYSEVKKPSDYFGVSKDNNVVVILGETLEWISFINNPEIYPNGNHLDQEDIEKIYPNITKYFMNESVIMDNYYAREKTDISEMYSILGSYPIDELINYDYDENTFAHSMPNIVKSMTDGGYQANYFHNGFEWFYNRKTVMPQIGFDNAYFTEQMTSSTPGMNQGVMVDYGDSERNLDSEMVEASKDLMFPTNGDRFYTQIATISSHGKFSYRKNLEKAGYYDDLKEVGLDVLDVNNTEDEYKFICYMACVMEVDKAIGKIFTELEDRNLIDNTTVMIFGDHNAYYDGLSYYVKGIQSEEQAVEDGLNYTELYRVPNFIYDKKLMNKIEENGDSRIISKFSGPQDMVPTLLDLLGIAVYKNMYYGSSFFSDEENILYSRAYGVFISQYAYFKNLNNLYFVNKEKRDNLDEYILELTTKGETLIEKVRYADQAFQLDFFGNETYYNDYYYRLKQETQKLNS